MTSKVFRNLRFSVVITVFLISMISACSSGGGGAPAPAQTFGVVALSNVGTIGILTSDLTSTSTSTLATVHLTGELGTFGGGLFDVVISPVGKTTLVSNFGDSTVHFIDTTDPSAPVSSGSVTIEFFAEDMAMTPDGRYVLITDGGFSSTIAVVELASRLVSTFTTTAGPQFQSVSVAPDGKTVLAADYWNNMVHVLSLSSSGTLSYVSPVDVANSVWDYVGSDYVKTLRPINLAISPDGKTAVVASVAGGYIDIAETMHADLAFPVLHISSPGVVELTDMVSIPSTTVAGGCQSVVFNPAGTKAYVMCTQPLPDPYPSDPDYPGPKNVIHVLNITAPGKAVNAGTPIEVEIYGRSQLFGVDTLAIDNPGRYLYVSNPTLSGARHYIQIVDLNTNTVVSTVNFDPIDTAVAPDPPDLTESFPAGIAFWHP